MQTSSLFKQTAQPTWKTLVPASMVSHLVRARNDEANRQLFLGLHTQHTAQL
jgi:hypothetical protein